MPIVFSSLCFHLFIKHFFSLPKTIWSAFFITNNHQPRLLINFNLSERTNEQMEIILMDNKTMNEIMKIQIDIKNSNAFLFQCAHPICTMVDLIFFHSRFLHSIHLPFALYESQSIHCLKLLNRNSIEHKRNGVSVDPSSN